MPRAFEEQAHRGQLDDVKDVVVVKILVGPEAAQLNAEPDDGHYQCGDDPLSILSPNLGRMNGRAEKRTRRSDRQQDDIPEPSKSGLFKMQRESMKGATGGGGDRSCQESERQKKRSHFVPGVDRR